MPGVEKTENEFRFRIKDPGLFRDDSFRYKKLKKKDKTLTGVSLLVAKLKNPPKGHEGSMVTQSVRFDRDKFEDSESVRKWVDSHSSLTKPTKESLENYISRVFIDETILEKLGIEESL